MLNTGWNDPFSLSLNPNCAYKRIISNSHSETQQWGYELGKRLKSDNIVCFFGDLGAGKTTFIKGLAAAAAGCRLEDINSPTYVYLNIYEGLCTVYHFDLYRLRDVDEFLGMGFDEYLFAGGICCVEWCEKIESILPNTCIRVVLKSIGTCSREISIYT